MNRSLLPALILSILLIPYSALGWELGQVVYVNEEVTPGVKLIWKAYHGGTGAIPPLIFGDRVYLYSQGAGGGKLYCFSHDGKLLWTFAKNLSDLVACSDFLAIGGYEVCALSHEGKLLWKYGVSGSFVSLGDMNRDKRVDAVVVTLGKTKVICLDYRSKSVKWEHPASVESFPGIGDVDEDRYADVVYKGYSLVVIDGRNGKTKFGIKFGRKGSSYFLLGDVDNDWRVEIITDWYDLVGSIMCYSYPVERNVIPNWEWRTEIDEKSCPRPLALGDIDEDGYAEIIVAGTNTLYCLRGRGGSIKWKAEGIYGIKGAVLGDVDGDDQVETIISAAPASIYCLDRDGGLKWKIRTEESSLSPPAIGDIDRDGRIEMAVIGYGKKGIAKGDGFICFGSKGKRERYYGRDGGETDGERVRLKTPSPTVRPPEEAKPIHGLY